MAGAALRLEGHEQLHRTGSPAGLGHYHSIWHLSANHATAITGNQARTRSYLLGGHMLNEDT